MRALGRLPGTDHGGLGMVVGILAALVLFSHAGCTLDTRGQTSELDASVEAGTGETGWGGGAQQGGSAGWAPDASTGSGGQAATGGGAGTGGTAALGGAAGQGGASGSGGTAGAGGSPEGGSAGGSGQGGAVDAGSGGGAGADAGPARVTNGLVALWELQEGSGKSAADTSGVAPPLELDVPGSPEVAWIPGGVRISAPSILAAKGAADKIRERCSASNEITIEAWIAPGGLSQSGPARIVTLSLTPDVRLFTLGQEANSFVFRLRTTETTSNGMPQVLSAPAITTSALQHVVCSRGAAGAVAFYLDSSFLGTVPLPGSISPTWDNVEHSFALANELTQDRPWMGDLHLVAIYDRALGASEVLQNYQAGADP